MFENSENLEKFLLNWLDLWDNLNYAVPVNYAVAINKGGTIIHQFE